MSHTMPQTERRWMYAGYAVTALWFVSFIVARFALDKDLRLEPTWLRVAAALLPVIPTALFLWFVIGAIQGLDELHRRVHLEALAIAYPLAILLLMTLGFLQLAIDLPVEDWSYRHVWAYLPAFYFLGLAIAWRRYR
jgi:hypothetical protein